jgi:hypothetical protein
VTDRSAIDLDPSEYRRVGEKSPYERAISWRNLLTFIVVFGGGMLLRYWILYGGAVS